MPEFLSFERGQGIRSRSTVPFLPDVKKGTVTTVPYKSLPAKGGI
jgi:hypothetical protein